MALSKHVTICSIKNPVCFQLTAYHNTFEICHTQAQFAGTVSIRLRSVLCDGHSNTLTLLSSHFGSVLEVCVDPAVTKLFPSWLSGIFRCCFNIPASILFHMMPPVLWYAPVSPAATQPCNLLLPTLCFMIARALLASRPLFPSKHKVFVYQTREGSSKR